MRFYVMRLTETIHKGMIGILKKQQIERRGGGWKKRSWEKPGLWSAG